MSYRTARRRTRQIDLLRTQFAQADGLAFADVLPAEQLEQALREEGAVWRDIVYSPLLTLWAFLGQVISPDGSCRAAVARVLAWLVCRGERPCTPATDPYCKARRRLPEALLRRLTRQTGRAVHAQAPQGWLWKGRRVKVADGTTVSMPDTPANQAVYPQLTSQQPGVGFPIARMAVVFCLACGTVLDAALGRYQGKRTGETALLRSLEDAFEPDDVLLADRYFGGYFDIAWWQQRQVDVVVRLHQRRRFDLRRGRRLGPDEHVVTWSRPARPEWLDEATYAAMPATLELREIRVDLKERGFRTKMVVVVTTLLDAQAYAADEVADLYRLRWHAELDLRCLKTTLGMDILRCMSPEMVRKEVWAHLLAYNLIRSVMAQAAQAGDFTPPAVELQGDVANPGGIRRAAAGGGRRDGRGTPRLVVTGHRRPPSRRPTRPQRAAGPQTPAQALSPTHALPW
jgi:hypothetical protein